VRSYTIRKRDSLVEIARRFLHDHRRWREIAELNGLRDADRIFPGMRIKLPPLEDDAAKTAT
jgi:nucleoid-associated protein YgaU